MNEPGKEKYFLVVLEASKGLRSGGLRRDPLRARLPALRLRAALWEAETSAGQDSWLYLPGLPAPCDVAVAMAGATDGIQ